MSGISGHFPDFEWIRPGKAILSENGEWKWLKSDSFEPHVPTLVKCPFLIDYNYDNAKRGIGNGIRDTYKSKMPKRKKAASRGIDRKH